MTGSMPMSREELLELAALDVFGLLDEYEAALYTRSFHHAPAAVQDEIRELQAAFAGEQALMPEVEPSPELRERVLQAVARAIEAESFELAPLAMIGRGGRSRETGGGRLGFVTPAGFWRAAAFVLTGGVLVLAYFGLQLRADNNKMWAYAFERLAQEEIVAILGRDFIAEFAPPNCQHIMLTPRDKDKNGSMHAVVGLREDAALLYGFDLPKGRNLALTATRNGREELRHVFRANHVVAAARLPLEGLAAGVTGVSWQVIDVASKEVLLSSRA